MSANSVTSIVQDRKGWFYRQHQDGALTPISGTMGVEDIPAEGALVVLVRGGQPTGVGSPMASRMARFLDSRRP